MLFFLGVLVGPVDLGAVDGLQFYLLVPQDVALVSALEIYQVYHCPVLLLLPRLFPPSALADLLHLDARQRHQLSLPSRDVGTRDEQIVEAGPLRHQDDPFLADERLQFLMRGYLLRQLLDGFVADRVEELFGGFYLFGREGHSQLLVAEDGHAFERTGAVQDWELVDFIVGKDGLQHYKINKGKGTGKEEGKRNDCGEVEAGIKVVI